MTRNDVDYFTRRERQERERAAVCEDSSARLIHFSMAGHYSVRLREAADMLEPLD